MLGRMSAIFCPTLLIDIYTFIFKNALLAQCCSNNVFGMLL